MISLLADPVFSSALADFASLGFQISDEPTPGSMAYGIVSARSNRRWWLIPLANRKVASGGFAMFQPVLPSAKILKQIAVIATQFGFPFFGTKKTIHISGGERLFEIFGRKDLHFAFFTGTDSPHRKAAVQVMDELGYIKGFVKVSRNDLIGPLLNHEAQTLNWLNSVHLESAAIPKVLFHGKISDSQVLATDTLKTSKSKTITDLTSQHINFLVDLAKKSACTTTEKQMIENLGRRYTALHPKLSERWRLRLEGAIKVLLEYDGSWGVLSLCHGDFTPWNTFFSGQQLYVFDFEYAEAGQPAGYDIIHFFLSLPKTTQQPAERVIEHICAELCKLSFCVDTSHASCLVLYYLCNHSLKYLAREAAAGHEIKISGETHITTAMLDAMAARKN